MGANFIDIITKNYWVLIFGLLAFSVLLVLFFWCVKTWRNGARYDYLTLQDEHSHDEFDKKAARKASVDASMVIGQYCLKGTSRYRIVTTYPEMGSRKDKHWFLVNDSLLKIDRLMTIMLMSEKSPLLQLNNNSLAKKAISELFLAIQHPFIQPILDIDFKTVKDQLYVVFVFPYNKVGSLKDIIYDTRCQDCTTLKKIIFGKPLEIAQIKTFGRQILESVLFLKDYREFPPIGEHLHSGNIIVQDGVGRLTGYENVLLGFKSKLHNILRKSSKLSLEDIETITFGHVIYEMCTGTLLDTVHPSTQQLNAIHPRYNEVTQVLKFIFDVNEGFPKLEEVANLNLFRHIDLREMHSLPGQAFLQPNFSAAVHKLIKQVRKNQRKRSHRSKEEYTNFDEMDRRPKLPSSNMDYYHYSRLRRLDMQLVMSDFSQDFSDEESILKSPPPPHSPLLMHTSFSADDNFFKYTMDYSAVDLDEQQTFMPSKHHLHVPYQNELTSTHNYFSSSVPSGMYKYNDSNWTSYDKCDPSEDNYYHPSTNNKFNYRQGSDDLTSPEFFTMDTVSLVDDSGFPVNHRPSLAMKYFHGTSV